MDDEPEMVELLSRFLEPLSSRIESAEDLHPALEMARRIPFNIILLDLRLKKTGKDEALAAIREFKRLNSAVVVVSGLPIPHLRDEVLAAGADEFVQKDNGFNSRAILLATYVATLKLPKGSYKSDSYLQHVALLEKMAAS